MTNESVISMKLPKFITKNRVQFIMIGVFFLSLVLFLVLSYSGVLIKADTINRTTKNFYVSPTGNDTNIGTVSAPFATFEKAKSMVKDYIATDGSLGVTVYFRAGIYRPADFIQFTAEDSGKPDKKVTYSNYPGEHPIIRGSRDITDGWTGTGILQAKLTARGLPADLKIDELFLNGTKQVLAQEPDFKAPDFSVAPDSDPYSAGTLNWFFASEKNSCDSKRNLIYNYKGNSDITSAIKQSITSSLVQPANNQPQVDIYPRYDWGNSTVDITSIDSSKIVLAADAGVKDANICPKNRYVLKNFMAALDMNKEWYQNKRTNILYFKPGVDISGKRVSVSALDKAFDFDLSSHDIVINGLTFDEFGDGRVIRIAQSENIDITNNTIKSSGGYGVRVNGSATRAATNINITGNNIDNMGRAGIFVAPRPNYSERLYTDDTRITKLSDHIVIANNIVHDIASRDSSEAGIDILYALGAVVSHNTVYNLPRMGIEVTANDTLVEHNKIYNVNLMTQDSAGIYLTGRSNTRGNVINNNFIKDTNGYGKYNFGVPDAPMKFGFGTFGIYFDLSTSGNTTSKNIVANSTRGCLDNNGGSYNSFSNNFCINAGTDKNYGTQVLMSENQGVFSDWRTELLDAYDDTYIPFVSRYHLNRADYETAYPELKDIADTTIVRNPGDYMVGNSLQKNIFYFPNNTRTTAYIGNQLGARQSIESNLFYLGGKTVTVNRTLPKSTDITTLADWQNILKFDIGSLTQNPLFVNIGADNYTLDSASPALKAPFSIQQIDQSFGSVKN